MVSVLGFADNPKIGADCVTVWSVLEDYTLTHELRASTADYYRRVVSALTTWYGGDVPREAFTVELCNRFLVFKQEAKLTSAYRKSLRNALRALLNHIGREGKLRPVRLKLDDPDCWTPAEVARLVDAAPNELWRQRIELGYYTGLSYGDLILIQRSDIRGNVLHWRRQKTGEPVWVEIPDSLLCRLPASGSLFGLDCTDEWFRRQFAKIVAAAGLAGTWKKLRKSAGTSVEARHPGAGHLFLANSRKVFEQHYLARKSVRPLSPEPLK